MRILCVCRLYSGLESSLCSGTWAPAGVPTIYKLFEALDRGGHEVRILLTEKGKGGAWGPGRPVEVSLHGLSVPLTVLPGQSGPGPFAGRVRRIRSGVRQLWQVAGAIRRFRPEVVYVDRVNVVPGALAARWFGTPTVLRVMGVPPFLWDLLGQRSLWARIARWSFRSPFALAVCTMDGSGGEEWMRRALRGSVPRCVLLNGVDLEPSFAGPPPRGLDALPKDRRIVLFLGRIVDYKGWREFVAGVLGVNPEKRSRLHVVIAGDGVDSAALHAAVAAAEDPSLFRLIGQVPHGQVPHLIRAASVVVSLNHQGNLINSNLEAFAQGRCMILPQSDPAHGIDTVTEEWFGTDAAIHIDRDRMAEGLTAALERLLDDPHEIKRRQHAMAAAAAKFLTSWDDRMARELGLLERVAAGRDVVC